MSLDAQGVDDVGRRALEFSAETEAAEQLVAEILQFPRDERAAQLDATCVAHPGLDGKIRALYRDVLHIDAWLDAPERLGGDDVAPESFPERLGDFRLLDRLGGGGMGVVYRAEQVSLGRVVALKLIRPEYLYFPKAKRRFQREVATIARLQHPGIVPVYAVGEENGVPFFAMELIEGCSLETALARLRRHDPGDLTGRDLSQAVGEVTGWRGAELMLVEQAFAGSWADAVLSIARQVAEALDHVHARGVIHRDIKPSNLMLTRGGRVMIVDFGLASAEGGAAITKTQSPIGSLAYMPPEQLRCAPADARSDLFSVGVTVFEMFSLIDMARYRVDQADRHRINLRQLPSLRSRNPAVSRSLSTMVATLTESDPARRYPTATALIADIDRCRAGLPIDGVKFEWLTTFFAWVNHDRWRRRLVAALVGAIVFFTSATATIQIRHRAAAESTAAKLAEDETRLEHSLVAERSAHIALQQVIRSAFEKASFRQKVDSAMIAEAMRADAVSGGLQPAARCELLKAAVDLSLTIRRLDLASAYLSDLKSICADAAAELGIWPQYLLVLEARLLAQGGESERALDLVQAARVGLRRAGPGIEPLLVDALVVEHELLVTIGRPQPALAVIEEATRIASSHTASFPPGALVWIRYLFGSALAHSSDRHRAFDELLAVLRNSDQLPLAYADVRGFAAADLSILMASVDWAETARSTLMKDLLSGDAAQPADPVRLARRYCTMADCSSIVGDLHGALDHARAAVDITSRLRSGFQEVEYASALITEASVLNVMGSLDEALVLADRARSTLERLDVGGGLRVSALQACTIACIGLGRFEEASAYNDQALKITDSGGTPFRRSRLVMLARRARLLAACGDPVGATAQAMRSLADLSGTDDLPANDVVSVLNESAGGLYIAHRVCEADGLMQSIQSVMKISTQIPARERAVILANAAVAACDAGDYIRGLRDSEECLAVVQAPCGQAVETRARARVAAGRCWLALGRPADARIEFSSGIAEFSAFPIAIPELVEALALRAVASWQSCGDLDAAEQDLAVATGVAESLPSAGPARLGWVAALAGRIALARGQSERAVSMLTSAAAGDAWAAGFTTVDSIASRLDLVDALLREREFGDAQTCLAALVSETELLRAFSATDVARFVALYQKCTNTE